MPIRVDYTPVGALANLAQRAGANLAKQTTFMNALRMKQLSEDIWARKRSQDMQFIQLTQGRQAQMDAQRIRQEEFDVESTQFERSLQFRYDALSSGETLTREMAALEAGQKERAFEIQEATGLRRAQKEEFDVRLKMMEFETPQQKMERELMTYGGKQGLRMATQQKIDAENARIKQAVERQSEKEVRAAALRMKEADPNINVEATVLAGRATYYPIPKEPKLSPELRMRRDAVRDAESREQRARQDLSSHLKGWGIQEGDKVAERLGVYLGQAEQNTIAKRNKYAELVNKYPTLAGGRPAPRGPVSDQARPSGVPVGDGQAPSPDVVAAAMRTAGSDNEAVVSKLLRTWGYDPSKLGK